MNDCLRFKDHGWCGHLHSIIKCLNDPVRLGQILTGCANLFPDKGYRVQPQDLDALVGQKQHLGQHSSKHLRVFVIQIPLVVMKRRPHPLAHLGVVGERAGVFIRKYFRQRAFDLQRKIAIAIHAIVALEFLLTTERRQCPFMLIGGMVEDKV